jgi:GrpB-like predicted nucleotidyltransferase (UPF0157 family)
MIVMTASMVRRTMGRVDSPLGVQTQGPEFRHRQSFPPEHLVRIGELDLEGETFRSYVHAVPPDSNEVERFLRFRDRLRASPGLLAKYVAVKHEAIASGVTDTDDYVVRKLDVIKEILGEDPGNARGDSVARK